jgi:hypothetical protein
VLPRVFQGIVPRTWGWSITSLFWRLVCDSFHRLCVTGFFEKNFYRLLFTPPPLVAIRSFRNTCNQRHGSDSPWVCDHASTHSMFSSCALRVDPVWHIACGIHRLSPIPPRSPMLIKHRPSHLTQGLVLPFHNTILGRWIRTRKLVLKTQVMAKGFKTRVSEFRAIVTVDSSHGISVPLVPQPQD